MHTSLKLLAQADEETPETPVGPKAKGSAGGRFAGAWNSYKALPERVRAVGLRAAAAKYREGDLGDSAGGGDLEGAKKQFELDVEESEKRRRMYVAKTR